MCLPGLETTTMSSKPTDVHSGGMPAEAPVDAAVLDHLGDEVSRTILAACARTAHSVGELSERCGVSEATIYRRLNDLMAAGLLEEQHRIDSGTISGGKEYTTALSRITVSLGSDGIGITTDDAGDDGAPSFAVVGPDGGETGDVVDLQLRLPEDRFGEFLSAWAELNDCADVPSAGAVADSHSSNRD